MRAGPIEEVADGEVGCFLDIIIYIFGPIQEVMDKEVGCFRMYFIG